MFLRVMLNVLALRANKGLGARQFSVRFEGGVAQRVVPALRATSNHVVLRGRCLPATAYQETFEKWFDVV